MQKLGAVGVAGDVDQDVAQRAVDSRRRVLPEGAHGARQLGERDLQFVELVVRASSTRGAWLVGPMNRPENRYDQRGWLCQ